MEIRVAARISVEQNQALRRVANAIQSSKSAAMRIAIERGLIEIQEQLNMEQLEVATERTYDDPS